MSDIVQLSWYKFEMATATFYASTETPHIPSRTIILFRFFQKGRGDSPQRSPNVLDDVFCTLITKVYSCYVINLFIYSAHTGYFLLLLASLSCECRYALLN